MQTLAHNRATERNALHLHAWRGVQSLTHKSQMAKLQKCSSLGPAAELRPVYQVSPPETSFLPSPKLTPFPKLYVRDK